MNLDLKKLDKGLNNLISDDVIYAASARWVVWNIYETLEHTLAPLPFSSRVEGMWRFDGQFYIPPQHLNNQ